MSAKPAMEPGVAAQFAALKRQSDPNVNQRLLKSVDTKISATPQNAASWKVKAAIECRLGNFTAARESYQQYFRDIGQRWEADESAGIVTPPNFHHRPDFQLPPCAVLDDFLDSGQMDFLLQEAKAAAPQMMDAELSRLENNVLDFSKRRTSVVKEFPPGRQALHHLVEERIEQFRQGLGIAPFQLGTHSIKLTYHGEGGFFFPHRDSDKILEPGSRAMTWLYYFGETPKKYRGGDLFLFESDTSGRRFALSAFIKVEPVINRFVVFPSWFFHAVSPLEMFADAAFPNGRFAISGHIHVHQDA